MKKIGRLRKTEEGYQLQYQKREDKGYEVVESSPSYERFPSMEDAISFIKNNGIILEDADLDKTVSFPCPKCEEDGNRSWTIKRDSSGFLCPRCGSTYLSHESAWPKKQC